MAKVIRQKATSGTSHSYLVD